MGKSVCIAEFTKALSHLRFANVSFTGAAAKNLTDKGAVATTIHRLIYNPIIRNGIVVGFKKRSRMELLEMGIDCIIVDEYSMVSNEIMKDLESYNIPMILVGDVEQLPPISDANEYIDIAHAKLYTVMRQALESDILRLATELRENGTKPQIGSYKDLGVFDKRDLQDEWLHPDIPIIVGKNDTRKQMNIKVAGDTNPKVDDRIVFLKNNYDVGVVNGQVAILKKVRHIFGNTYKIDCVDVNNGERYTNISMEWGDLQGNQRMRRGVVYATHGFSITCHKAQGATLEKAIIFDESWIMREEDLKRRWLYTALTRISKRGILLY